MSRTRCGSFVRGPDSALPRRRLDVRPALAGRVSGQRIPPPQPLTALNKSATGSSLAHDERFIRRERGFVRGSAPTCNDLRTLTASGPLVGAGALRSRLRTGSAPGPAQAPPAARGGKRNRARDRRWWADTGARRSRCGAAPPGPRRPPCGRRSAPRRWSSARTAAVGHAGGGGSGWSVRASRRGARPGREGEGLPGGTNRHAPGRTAR